MEIKGSKTEKNLKAAFAGESQARNKYTCFADIARDEGWEQMARVFLETAENEKAHAKRALEFLKGMGNTEANLKAAAEGEHYEWSQMYPEFEQVAREEGFTEIANFFKGVADIEKRHEKRYLALLQELPEGKTAKKGVIWLCRSCGWVEERSQPPQDCPTCKAPQSGFEAFDRADRRYW